jgi:hypothetical protein
MKLCTDVSEEYVASIFSVEDLFAICFRASTQNMEGISSSETSPAPPQNALRYSPEDGTFRNDR